KDHFEIVINSNDDYSFSDDDSLYNDNIKYVEASPHDSELVSLEVADIVIPEDEEIEDDNLQDEEIEDDNLREKLLNVNLLIAKIEARKDNPTPSSEFLTKSSSTSPKSFLEETNTFDNSLPKFKNFCFDLEEISSGSTTTHSDISLLDYEAFYFYDDHIEEISSGSTTTHFDISLSKYDSFIFDLSNDQFPPTDRSAFTHEDFADELAHIISPLEYDCFYWYTRKLEDSCQRILSSKSSFPQLQLGIQKQILKKKTKTKPKTTKPNTEWKKSEKAKSFEAESQPQESQKSIPRKSKVNPEKVKVKPDKAEAEKEKKIQVQGTKDANPKSCINLR
nr:hypothetical protein [Tanacetum cinerariifolium]